MLNLIKLEMKRMNLPGVALAFVLINAAIVGMLLLLGTEPDAVEEFFSSAEDIMMLIELLVVAAFVIYASVLLSTMIIEEFKNKTITVLFMYPVSRKKVLLAKLIIISLLTFFFVIASMIIVFYSISIFNGIYSFTPVVLPSALLGEYAIHLIVIAIACAGLSLIPLFFGMMKYSVPVTIVSSVLIVALLSSSVDPAGTNLLSYTAVPLLLGIVGFFAATLVVGRAVRQDF
ncbi:ABC transporter permease [Planococcus beijingensis]|uniref:ABC transporter permease n=1 Tax=Planococcus beijingensis TaxID=2782551 RepID=UPI00193C26FF|nr:ABC transporter permease [Planococcus beijingensis]